ncbi:hypothetical protein FACS189427_02030 [Planctomycetales bacterium]|nr:hypothetical protein FACS189427_02030 [Planctomycetales bacterium]
MKQNDSAERSQLIKDILGYLNFSSGSRDNRFFTALNRLFTDVENDTSNNSSVPLCYRVLETIEQGLAELSKESNAFKTDDQAGLILKLVRENFLPEYKAFHCELLFHQKDELLFNPFFLAKTFENILQQSPPWTETQRIVPKVITDLNDYIGYRPVPILEGEEKHQPYQHELIAAVPLFMKGIGIAQGRYSKLVEQAIAILQETAPQILFEACFDLNRLEEIVLDPRAYDFDHPVNRKPNYHFGMWDPHTIDKDGYYSRFVVHQVTLEGILRRLTTADTGEDSDTAVIPKDELLYEAGAVLAGTMLMGSGVCGDTPSTYNSETSLTSLMPIIAGYRDQFYEQMLEKIPEKMKPRIEKERERLYQPFGGCRQNLNKQLARSRADQLQRMHIARVYARMGYYEAAKQQTGIIFVASARILTVIDCLITETHHRIDEGQYAEAAENMPKIENWIRRGINCGAIVDPWTILGFGGNFSLFHSVENSIHDHRIDDLIDLLENIFDLYSRLQKAAAAAGNGDLQADLSDKMSDLAGWWDQYGSTDVSGLDGFSGAEAWESAAKVSTALAVWHNSGTSAGDIAFWNRHVERFKSTKAFVLLAEALLEQHDHIASMALMMYWLSNSDTIPLTEGDYTFHSVALRWMEQLWRSAPDNDVPGKAASDRGSEIPKKNGKVFPPLPPEQRWELTKKFFDFIEANADVYWSAPAMELDDNLFETEKEYNARRKEENKEAARESGDEILLPDDLSSIMNLLKSEVEKMQEDLEDEKKELKEEFADNSEENNTAEEDDDSPFSAAYDGVTYHDSTNDGIDDSLQDNKPANYRDEDELQLANETDRVGERLTFIITMAKLWKYAAEKIAAAAPPVKETPPGTVSPAESDPLTVFGVKHSEIVQYADGWLKQMVSYIRGLDTLLTKAARYKVPSPKATTDSLLEYDRLRGTKEILLDRIIWTQVETRDAKMVLESYLGPKHWKNISEDWEKATLEVCNYIFQGNIKDTKRRWSAMLRILSRQTILYVPTSRGGEPGAIVRCRRIQQTVMRMMQYAPRLGLLSELFQVLSTIKTMEEKNAVSPGAITEFDRLVETATRAVTQSIAVSSKNWKAKPNDKNWVSGDFHLVECMEDLIEQLLDSWLKHSQQIRISSVESLTDREFWDHIKQFIQRYGHDIFTQQYMGFGNLRAVIHQGVGNYLQSLLQIKKDEGEVETAATLIEDIEKKRIKWKDAVTYLESVFDIVAENYSEFVDYNSTTTHSDRGEKLFMFLDMLRVQVGYERISWNLKPVYWVHDSLIRSGCVEAAMLWEQAIQKRSVTSADEHLRLYHRLSEKYGMWLPSVYERLQERFVRPLQIDRMCGLVPKAMREAHTDGKKPSFSLLHEQIEYFAKEPMGIGFEMPEWLTSLQEEVMASVSNGLVDNPSESEKRDENGPTASFFEPAPHIQQVPITQNQIEKLLETLKKNSKTQTEE